MFSLYDTHEIITSAMGAKTKPWTPSIAIWTCYETQKRLRYIGHPRRIASSIRACPPFRKNANAYDTAEICIAREHLHRRFTREQNRQPTLQDLEMAEHTKPYPQSERLLTIRRNHLHWRITRYIDSHRHSLSQLDTACTRCLHLLSDIG